MSIDFRDLGRNLSRKGKTKKAQKQTTVDLSELSLKEKPLDQPTKKEQDYWFL